VGDIGEELAVKFLEEKGYIILDRNYRSRFGEIDIIAKYKDYYIFIEVKTRRFISYGRPAEAINSVKINRIMKTVNFYLSHKKIHDCNMRIDAIEIFIKNSKDIQINHIENIVYF
jgi:putative endonuclease